MSGRWAQSELRPRLFGTHLAAATPSRVLELGAEHRHDDEDLRVPREGGIFIGSVVLKSGLQFGRVDESASIRTDVDDKIWSRREAFILLNEGLTSIRRRAET